MPTAAPCPHCQRDGFPSEQARSGHMRWCKLNRKPVQPDLPAFVQPVAAPSPAPAAAQVAPEPAAAVAALRPSNPGSEAGSGPEPAAAPSSAAPPPAAAPAPPPFVAQVAAPAPPPPPVPPVRAANVAYVERMPLPNGDRAAHPRRVEDWRAPQGWADPTGAPPPDPTAEVVGEVPPGARPAGSPPPAPEQPVPGIDAVAMFALAIESEFPDEPLTALELGHLRSLWTFRFAGPTSLPALLLLITGRRMVKHPVYGPQLKQAALWCLAGLKRLAAWAWRRATGAKAEPSPAPARDTSARGGRDASAAAGRDASPPAERDRSDPPPARPAPRPQPAPARPQLEVDEDELWGPAP